jgi:hypothetical protein
MSLSGEEPKAPMSLSGEEPKAPMRGPEPPRISRRRAALSVVAGLTVVGALVGTLWAWIAPPVHGVIALTRSGERVHVYLGSEAENFFIAAFLMLGLLTVLGVVTAVLVWQWRPHRGPVMALALSVGLSAAAGIATGVGAALVRWHYGVTDIAGAPVTPQHRVDYVTQAPPVFFAHTPLQMAATIVLPAAAAALIYALLAVSTSRDDLGGWPPVEPGLYQPPAPVIAAN